MRGIIITGRQGLLVLVVMFISGMRITANLDSKKFRVAPRVALQEKRRLISLSSWSKTPLTLGFVCTPGAARRHLSQRRGDTPCARFGH